MRSKGILEWLEKCPYVGELEGIDINQLPPEQDTMGLYKQPGITIEELIDGTSIITENYYALFRRPAQLVEERITNEEYLEAIESWIDKQVDAGDLPSIGMPIYDFKITNSFYMNDRGIDDAIYQYSFSIKYMKGVQHD